jgi:hypothetical protein
MHRKATPASGAGRPGPLHVHRVFMPGSCRVHVRARQGAGMAAALPHPHTRPTEKSDWLADALWVLDVDDTLRAMGRHCVTPHHVHPVGEVNHLSRYPPAVPVTTAGVDPADVLEGVSVKIRNERSRATPRDGLRC